MLTLIDADGRAHEVVAKDVGLCWGDVCVPQAGPDDLEAWAERAGYVLARDAGEEESVVAIAPSAETHRRADDGRAPSLTLPDVDGDPVSFDDLSGSKRVLVTWASWCGCRHELGGWQRLQDELAGAGLRLFSVALDADPEHARPWIEAASPTYPVAVDTAHVTAERYGITNVPSVVWVDEHDRIVKPPTIAPGDDQFVEFTRIGADQHHDLLRAWVRDGVLPKSAGADGPRRTDDEQRALAHRRIAAHHQRAGRGDRALAQLARAQELAPWDWTVRRGGIAMTGGDPFLGEEFTSFWEEWDTAGRPGYTPTT
ncbi:TlpA disulfide reductase family protein [Nocardioides sp. YIM 152315]|uniref:TlpA disulfide reductase family protein n=1 Tax=Nocardioides sp. YIM 152315 TaxID=3031760 RepID=UPI0023DB7EBA|nr:TlpA disulfide reductase family protein [Nocardioides sp. YIM 152315]MDF1605257.1 TlpA disulfide reductase family protein [Nocardioides sp. YIM 152315]